MKRINSLIIGQGIAGTMVAYQLQQRGLSIMVIDSGMINTASRIAAGMFSSISGKRKTFDVEMFTKQKFAIGNFRMIEKLLGVKFLHEENIIQLFHSEKEKTETVERMKDENFSAQIELKNSHIKNIKDEYGSIAIKNSGWIDCESMLKAYRNYLIANNSFSIDDFKYDKLEIKENHLHYKDYEATNIIFCEGYQKRKNPFFENENIIPCKGDVITLKHANHRNKKILKRSNYFLIPTNEETVKAGSTYLWSNDDEQLNESHGIEIKNKVDEIFSDEFEIINHQTAIRPTTKNREVIAKQHSLYKNMFMLNGLGTKGIIQAPFYANYITEMIKIK